jgi:hypothetical protein
MKKYNKSCAFYIPKNKDSFWGGGVMASMQQNPGSQGRWQPYIYETPSSKTSQNDLQ